MRRGPAAGVAVLVIGLAGVLAAGAQAPPEAAGRGRMLGTVARADTGSPVRFASVRIVASGPVGRWLVTTDEAGRFVVEGLPPGRYTVSATAPPLLTLGPGQRDPSDPPRVIQLADGETYENAHIRLPRGGVITGHVLDAYGDPIVNASVEALRAVYFRMGDRVTTNRRLAAAGSARTDDRGQFRLHSLPPGAYYVTALRQAPGMPAPQIDPTESRPVVTGSAGGFARTFFPGTPRMQDARLVEAAAGIEVAGIDFRVSAARLIRIAGTILDARGRPSAGMVVSLSPARALPALQEIRNVQSGTDGSFELPNVQPGDYRIDVISPDTFLGIAERGAVGGPSGGGLAYGGLSVTAADADLEGLVIATSAGHVLAGRIVVDGGDASALPPRLSISALDIDRGDSIYGTLVNRAAQIAADGSFELRDVAGSRLIRVSGLPQGWILKAVYASGVDVVDRGLVMDRDVRGVEVVLSARPAEVHGTVSSGPGIGCGGCAVILFPQDRDLWSGFQNRHVTSVPTEADGSFAASGLPAGQYFAAPVEVLIDGLWAEPWYLDRLRNAATALSLREGAALTVNLSMPATF